MMRKAVVGALVALATPLAGVVTGQEVGGMLFAYAPHPGERAEFDAGYRAHLEWHRAARDSLPWYGWDVLAGRRLGQFVDGTFGVPFGALDRRVDPAGDAADAGRTFEPHAVATERWAVRVRPELGTALPLKERSPSLLAQVVTYTVSPAHGAAFDAMLGRIRAGTGPGLLPYSVYEVVVGGTDTQRMVVVWRDRLGTFDDPERDPTEAIAEALAERPIGEVRVESELWRLRRDLTLLPGDAPAEGRARAGVLRGPCLSDRGPSVPHADGQVHLRVPAQTDVTC